MVLIAVFLAVTAAVSALTGIYAIGAVLGVIAAVAYYLRDVRRHPLVRCRACKGSGGDQSSLGGGEAFRKPFGDCWCCGGRKAHPRLALRFTDRARYEEFRRKVIQGRKAI